jgi:hypothetical protein
MLGVVGETRVFERGGKKLAMAGATKKEMVKFYSSAQFVNSEF